VAFSNPNIQISLIFFISVNAMHYNNTLNQLTKADKNNTTQYHVYDYQGNRVRTVVESDHKVQNQRDHLPLLDISTNQAKQQNNTLHIGTHILSESNKDKTYKFKPSTIPAESGLIHLASQETRYLAP
jgi:hypothetical protein